MLKILITGGSGFIGESLKDFFEWSTDYKIYTPSSKELNLSNSTMVDNFLTLNQIDVIVHTANHHFHPRDINSKDLELQLNNNITMFFNLLRNIDKVDKLIYFGSGAEYPREMWFEKISENDIGNKIPTDPYGLSKIIMNNYAKNHNKIYNLRLFGVFGELDNWRYRFIPNICVKAIFDLDLVINQNALFDFTYVNDICEVTNKFITNTYPNGDYNLCSSRALELIEIANIVKQVSNKDLNLIVNNEKIETKYGGNNQKLQNTIGNHEFININNSIKIVYDYLKKFKNKINIDEIAV